MSALGVQLWKESDDATMVIAFGVKWLQVLSRNCKWKIKNKKSPSDLWAQSVVSINVNIPCLMLLSLVTMDHHCDTPTLIYLWIAVSSQQYCQRLVIVISKSLYVSRSTFPISCCSFLWQWTTIVIHTLMYLSRFSVSIQQYCQRLVYYDIKIIF